VIDRLKGRIGSMADLGEPFMLYEAAIGQEPPFKPFLHSSHRRQGRVTKVRLDIPYG
jgi:hypothetical protein